MHVKWSVILTDCLGPAGDLNHVRNKGTRFASCAFTFEGSWLVAPLQYSLFTSLKLFHRRFPSSTDLKWLFTWVSSSQYKYNYLLTGKWTMTTFLPNVMNC